MTEPTEAGEMVPSPHLSPTFVWMELNRRIDANAQKIERLDTSGPRGMDALRQDVGRLRQDLLDHESAHQRAADLAVTSRRWFIGTVVALVTPLYPLIIWLIQRGAG